MSSSRMAVLPNMPFMVTEVYTKENGKWKLAQLTFSHLLRPVKMNNNNQ
jgi:hypothetical protein